MGEKIFSKTDYEAYFVHKDVYEYRASDKYDLVICQAVLCHLDTSDAFLNKMIEEQIIRFLMTHGMSRKEAAEHCDRNLEIADFFQNHPDVEYTFVKGTMIVYGKK